MMRGSPALEIVPKSEFGYVAAGFPKFTRLNALNASKRRSIMLDSVGLKCFTKLTLVVNAFGPTATLRDELPGVLTGCTENASGSRKWKRSSLGLIPVLGSPTRSGRRPPPLRLK